MKEKESWENEKEKRLFLGNVPLSNDNSNLEKCKTGYKVTFPWKLVKRIIIGKNMLEGNIARMTSIAKQYELEGLNIVVAFEEPFR